MLAPDFYIQESFMRYRHAQKQYVRAWTPSRLERLLVGTMPLAGMVQIPVGRGPEHKINLEDTRDPVTALVEHATTTTKETAVLVDVKKEMRPQESTLVSGGAPAPRKPLAEAAKEEDLSNHKMAEIAVQLKPENDLRRLRFNSTTKLVRQASHAKEHDYKTFIVPTGTR